MMQVIIPAAVAIVVALLSFYYFINRKEKCPSCGSTEISPTGNKQYKESSSMSLLAGGSPDSYNEFEHKCGKCGNIFWVKKEALITN